MSVYCSQKFGKAPLNQHNKYLTTLSCCQHQWLAVIVWSKTCTQTSCNWARKKTKNTLTATKKRNLTPKSHSIMKILQTTLIKWNGMCVALGCTGETIAACVLPKTVDNIFSQLISWSSEIIFRFKWARPEIFYYLKREYINSIR